MRQWLLAIAVMVGLGVVSLAVPAPVAMAGLVSGGGLQGGAEVNLSGTQTISGAKTFSSTISNTSTAGTTGITTTGDIVANSGSGKAVLGGLGADLSYAGLWLGNITPNASNFSFLSNGTSTIVNGVNGQALVFSTGNGERARVSLAGLKIGTGGTEISSSPRGTATLDFASAAAGACSAVLTITVTGAVAGAEVALGVPNAANTTGSQFFAWTSATDTVSVKHCCESGTCDPASATFAARVFNP